MELLPKKIPMKVGHKFIAVLNQHTAHALDVQPADRIMLTNLRTKTSLSCILDVTESRDIRDNQVGLFVETWERLDVKRGDKMFAALAEKPLSSQYIRKKLDGKKLSVHEIESIVQDIVNDDLSDIEMTYFAAASYMKDLDDDETIALTKSIVKYGQKLHFRDRVIADKHCIGGVPGNRTTMLVVPIVVAAGVKMPKTSSRAITSPAGTADTMEVLCNVTLNAKELVKITNRVGGFIAWGGGVDLAAADDRMIRVRYPMSLDPHGMLLASIMAKKFAVSANHVLIDIPIGPEVKVKTRKQAQNLKKDFEHIGRLLGMKISVIMTDGSQPIGNGIGPVLEVQDVLKILRNEPEAPFDLREKALKMACIILEMTKKAKKGQGYKLASEMLTTGAAYQKLQEMIEAQGKRRSIPDVGEFQFHVVSDNSGYIRAISNRMIAHIARMAGAPQDKGAGVYLHKKVGEKVFAREPLYTIYAENKERLDQTIENLKSTGYDIR